MGAGRLTKPGFKAGGRPPIVGCEWWKCARARARSRPTWRRYVCSRASALERGVGASQKGIRQSGLGVKAVDDQEWFAAFPDRRLRMREASLEEAGPTRPGARMLAIVARGRAPFVFQAGRDFDRLDNDRAITTLLSEMEKPAN
jgi:hypothetical protein